MEFGNIKNKIADYLFNRERETSMTETLPNSSGQMIGKPAELKKNDFEMSYLKDRGFIMNTLAKKMPVVAAGVDRLAKEYDTSRLTVHNLPGTGPLAETRSGKFIAGPGQAAAAVMSQVKPEEAQAAEPEPVSTPAPFKVTDMIWREGNSMPAVRLGDQERPISEFKIQDFPETQPIKNITIKEKNGATHTLNSQQIQTANTIYRVAKAVAPEYADYLIRLANFEGLMYEDTRNYMFNDTYTNSQGKQVHYSSRNIEDADKYGGLWSTDRGVFQINDYFFPGISEEIADDPVRATLFVLSAIEAGHQDKWHADPRTRAANAEIEYEN